MDYSLPGLEDLRLAWSVSAAREGPEGDEGDPSPLCIQCTSGTAHVLRMLRSSDTSVTQVDNCYGLKNCSPRGGGV